MMTNHSLMVTEQNRQAVVKKVLPMRGEALELMKTQVLLMENQLSDRDERIKSLELSLSETQMNLESARDDMATFLATTQRQLEDQHLQHRRQLEAKEQEMNDLRNRHKLAIQVLAKGTRETLQELETQLDNARESEAEAQQRLASALQTVEEQTKRMKEWERVSEKMSREVTEVKGKLKSSEFAKGKLREEVALWKKFADKIEEERKSVVREVDLQKKVLDKFGKVEDYLRIERQQRNIMLTIMNRFGESFMKDLKSLQDSKKTNVLVFAGTQTETHEDKNDIINILEQKGIILEEELNKKENHLQNLSAQNATLRGVILKMKKEKENLELEKEQMDEEERVSKLEESVRLLKSNFLNDQKDLLVWSSLQGVRKQVSCFKTQEGSLKCDKNLLKN